MATVTITRELKKVDEAVERVLNDQEQRFPEAASIGDAVRQGDIYIQKIDDVTTTPAFYKKATQPTYPLQLAQGNTKGSRHMLEADDTAVVYLSVTDEFGTSDDWEQRRQFNKDVYDYACRSVNYDGISTRLAEASRLVERHIINALNFCGPIFCLTKEARISHPEHGDWLLPPGSYRIVFQRTLDSTNRIQRVLD